MKNIVVNAYPLRSSGALVILKQFIDGVCRFGKADHMFYIFVDSSLDLKSDSLNVKFIKIELSPLKKRLFWFNFSGLNKYLKKYDIKADFLLSLANVNTVIDKDIPNYVYFHQSLTIYDHKWSLLNVEELKYWIYKNYYRCVIKRSLQKHTQVIVQLECIKDRYAKTYSIAEDRVIVVTPNVIAPKLKEREEQHKIDSDYINLIYPATPLKYKNHSTIIEALNIISKSSDKKVRLYLTCKEDELKGVKLAPSDSVEIVFMGSVEYDYLVNLYYKMDALLFPSFIESFGLPMIEAATSGVKILAADTDFANEVLKNYDGAEFIATFNSESWATKILDLKKDNRYTPMAIENNKSWGKLFEIINKI